MIGRTEQRNPRTITLSSRTPSEVAAMMDDEEHTVLEAVAAARPGIAQAATWVADALRGDGRVFLVGAGTSGRLCVGEAAEMPPTFGAEDGRFVPVVAASRFAQSVAVSADEDDTAAGPAALDAANVGDSDVVIGVAASGHTPFVIATVTTARKKGARTVGIANNPDSPLLDAADLGILLATGPEVLTGSTRLNAATAQKLALNRITMGAMVSTGRVIENLMIEVRPVHAKLRARCIRIVGDLVAVDPDDAVVLLEAAGWSVRAAVLAARPDLALPLGDWPSDAG